MSARLVDLNPRLEGTLDGGFLRFDCPFPGHTHSVRIRVHRAASTEAGGVKTWQAVGEYPDTLSIFPSIDLAKPGRPCWHGFITDGGVS